MGLYVDVGFALVRVMVLGALWGGDEGLAEGALVTGALELAIRGAT